MQYNPHNYQSNAGGLMRNNDRFALILDMGLGKTSVVLTETIGELNDMKLSRPLIVGPKKVIESTWTDEIEKWDHLTGLTISKILGNETERIAAIKAPADMYAVTVDFFVWLVNYWGEDWPYDAIIVDESSKFKSPSSNRTKALMKVSGLSRRVTLLTGTPMPESYLDLWSQIFILDGGERLGRTQTAFRNRFFYPGIVSNGFVKKWVLRPYAQEEIHRIISDIAVSMSAADYLDLKPRIDIVQTIELSDKDRKAYKQFERNRVLELDGGTVTAANMAGLYNKLLQFCNGAVYDTESNYHIVNTAKMEALEENIEALQGQPVIVFYQFRSDAERIIRDIPGAVFYKGPKELYDWNAGRIKVLLAHAASAGHGLNMQDGGRHMLWYGLPWSLEQYLQAVRRLDRQGQKGTVINKAILVKGTVEELVYKRQTDKDFTQQQFINAVKFYIGETYTI